MRSTIQNILTGVFILLLIITSVFLYDDNEVGLAVTAALTLIDVVVILIIDDDTTHYIGE